MKIETKENVLAGMSFLMMIAILKWQILERPLLIATTQVAYYVYQGKWLLDGVSAWSQFITSATYTFSLIGFYSLMWLVINKPFILRIKEKYKFRVKIKK